MAKNPEDVVISRWWEAKARVELSSSLDTKEIGLICSFVPFQDPDTPCRLLAMRENCIPETILTSLGDTRKVRNDRREGEKTQSDNEIRSLVTEEVMEFLNDRHISFSKAPNHRTIAKDISFRISSVFCTATFSDWIRVALGYGAESFSRLSSWMSAIRRICRGYLKESPRLRLGYEGLEKELRSLHPWAHWLLATSLRSLDVTPTPPGNSLILKDSDELRNSLAFLLGPIRTLFARKDQDLTQMLSDLAVLNLRFQHDIVRDNDWTRPLSTDFSFRKGLYQKDLAGFAASITKKDRAYFDQLCGTDFQSISSGILGPLDERLLKLSDDVRACATADIDLVEPVAEVIMHLLSMWNFASATAALAGLKSVNIRPRQLSKFWKLIGSNGNHFAYRLEYLKGPWLPCPTPHVRELEHTQQPQTALAGILKFKSSLTSRDERLSSRIESTEQQPIPEIQFTNTSCLVCRHRESEYEGLRLKCSECYRGERIYRMTSPAIRKHEYEALDEEERSTKRSRFASSNLQEATPPSSLTVADIAPPTLSSGYSANAQGFRSGISSEGRHAVPPTPPSTPNHQTASSLPHISEFDAGLLRLRLNLSNAQSKAERPSPPRGASRCSEPNFPLPIPAKNPPYYLPFAGWSTGKGGAFGRLSLPPPKATPQPVTSDPSLGEMFAEAALAAGRQFYPPQQS